MRDPGNEVALPVGGVHTSTEAYDISKFGFLLGLLYLEAGFSLVVSLGISVKM